MSGGAGRTFAGLTRKAGIKKSDLTILNVIQCHPPGDVFPTEKRASYITPKDAENSVAQCLRNHVKPMLESRPWQRAYVLGDQATAFITEKWASADKWRGSVLPIPMIDPEVPRAIVTLSPQQVQKQQKLFPVVVNDLKKSLRVPEEHYNLYPSVRDVEAFDATEFTFDIETSYEATEEGMREIFMVALSERPGHALVVPFTQPYRAELSRIFANATHVIGHNIIQFDLPQLAFRGITVQASCVLWDTMLMQHLRFPDLPHDLEFVASQFTSKPAWKHDKATKQLYAARDVDANGQLFSPLMDEMISAGLQDLYELVQVPLAKICRLITDTGMATDPDRVSVVALGVQSEIEALEKRLPEALRSRYVTKTKMDKAPEGYVDPTSGKPRKRIPREFQERVVPYRSNATLKALLYDEWGLPPQINPKTLKVTTDKTALDKLTRKLISPTSPIFDPERGAIVKTLKEINGKEHFISSLGKALEEGPKQTRVRPQLHVHGTSSGRFSSSGDAGNFQNKPEDARYLYVPSYPDWEMAELDYSNIENRLTALLANDPRLAKYDDPKHSDYKVLASRHLGIPYDEVVKEKGHSTPYGMAKVLVLGTNYGLGAAKIAATYDLPLQEVKDLMLTWKREIKETIRWQGEVSRQAKTQGWLVTPFGRKRWFYDADYHTKALSFLPQSVAADVIFRAMIGLMYKRINWPEEKVRCIVQVYEPLPKPARMILQVHDSLLFEYPKSMREEVLRVVKKVMEQPFAELGGYKIPVSIAISAQSWGEVE